MKKLNFKYLILSVFSILAISATAQQDYTLNPKESKLIISGTSSIHDWEMKAGTFSAQTKLDLSNANVSKIQSVDFTCKVADIESGKRIMDSKAYDALKEKKHPNISFQLNPNDAVNVSGKKAKLTGHMTIAGQKKEVSVECNFDVQNENQFSVSGKVPLKMTDFGIEPPTAMLGTLETGDLVTIEFDLKFTKGLNGISGLK